MIENPLVSVVIPTYNREKMLEKAMQSVLNQTYANLELIIADDCSTDKTEELVKRYMDKDNRVRYVKADQNAGAAVTRNMGAALAKGDYLAFNDSDSVWTENKLERQLGIFESHQGEEVGMVYHPYIQKSEHSEMMVPFQENPSGWYEDKEIFQYLLEMPLVGTPTMMIPMHVWKQIGGFDIRLQCLEDYELSLRIAKQYPVYYTHEALLIDYFTEDCISENMRAEAEASFSILREFAEDMERYKTKACFLLRIWKQCKRRNKENEFEEQFERYVEEFHEDEIKLRRQMSDYERQNHVSNSNLDLFAEKWLQVYQASPIMEGITNTAFAIQYYDLIWAIYDGEYYKAMKEIEKYIINRNCNYRLLLAEVAVNLGWFLENETAVVAAGKIKAEQEILEKQFTKAAEDLQWLHEMVPDDRDINEAIKMVEQLKGIGQ